MTAADEHSARPGSDQEAQRPSPANLTTPLEAPIPRSLVPAKVSGGADHHSREGGMTDWPFDSLVPLSYDVIVADPPWDFENYSAAGTKKGADEHYTVMPLREIKALPVGDLGRGDTLLLLWTTGWAIATGQAQDVARAWGFAPISEIVWLKKTASGKNRMGTGYRVRSMHEPILLCKVGNPSHTPFPSHFDGVAREHSRKPQEFYDLVLRCTPAAVRRADLFSRDSRPGFIGWGHEHGKFDAAPVTIEDSEDMSAPGERIAQA